MWVEQLESNPNPQRSRSSCSRARCLNILSENSAAPLPTLSFVCRTDSTSPIDIVSGLITLQSIESRRRNPTPLPPKPSPIQCLASNGHLKPDSEGLPPHSR
jgi:hypothetical protein